MPRTEIRLYGPKAAPLDRAWLSDVDEAMAAWRQERDDLAEVERVCAEAAGVTLADWRATVRKHIAGKED